ncbi:AAA domain-containing protein [Nocardia wallacei]|uniref:AAA domain-containing protein n=1 Tax=Nocardia wallacei TaxID=480035 RepID=UPI002454803F|nr:AAA domain-containing protein [Nocardia wallacei]
MIWTENEHGGHEPALQGGTGHVAVFKKWQAAWAKWAAAERQSRETRKLYEDLELAAKLLEQQDDEYEFVLVAGLLSWKTPDGTQLRRHLISEPLVPTLDRETAEVVVRRGGGKRRLEDRELLEGQEGYYPQRSAAIKAAVLDSDTSLLDTDIMADVETWLAAALDQPMQAVPLRNDLGDEPTPTVQVCAAPAMWLRPRSKVLLAEAYRYIADELKKPGAQVPVALAQLVIETEKSHRDRWLAEQGAVTGDILGHDPLFPKKTNREQERVMDLLRTETAVVVQGPPGTGKTHTIANLISTLLARGQRVLVTSQKEQALKVLRDQIPEELRKLCVLLAGGSRNAAAELQSGLDTLSGEVASKSSKALADQAEILAEQRVQLRSKSAELNRRILALRDAENVYHDPVVPGDSGTPYYGTLAEIVRTVRRNEPHYGWMPDVTDEAPKVPPLSTAEFVQLRRLLLTETPERRARGSQLIPDRDQLPSGGDIARLVHAERDAEADIPTSADELAHTLARADEESLRSLHLLTDSLQPVLRQLGYTPDGTPSEAPNWAHRATTDLMTGRRLAIWDQLLSLREEPQQLREVHKPIARHQIELEPITPTSLATARGWLKAGWELHRHLNGGKKLRKILPAEAQRRATPFLNAIKVDDQRPSTTEELDVALTRLEIETRAAHLIAQWAGADVHLEVGPLLPMLAELEDHAKTLDAAAAISGIARDAARVLQTAGVVVDLSTPAALARTLASTHVALRRIDLEKARFGVDRLVATIDEWASRSDACPELVLLREAVIERDLDAYTDRLQLIENARFERDQELHSRQLGQALELAHPRLLELLRTTAHDQVWDDRLASLPDAWAWSTARRFIEHHRTLDEENRLTAEFDNVEDTIRRITEQLAGVEAKRACLNQMTDTHARGLRTYQQHMFQVGAGKGRKTREFRRAAREAMAIAKEAVPAWVVPLPNLLENLPPEKNSFDVVIVDEASQVGLEHLFLLWMAPRLIVVGDDKQCTPGATRMGKLEPVFQRLDEHLGDVPSDIRLNFTSKANLFGLLSARSGKDAVVALREHFRSMPQIINWSSTQFYGQNGIPGLISLREHTVDDLEPLRVVAVDDAFTEGREQQIRNPVEAKRIVEQLVDCLNDARYSDKTIGIVVLQGRRQIRELEDEIKNTVTPEQREHHKIRVGTAPDFQGDERDVIFLSMVVAKDHPMAQRATSARQAFNVAASRARDQMWLFTSVGLGQLKESDLRASLLAYMTNPPSIYGKSPDLETVSETKPCEPFDSLLEQRVFRSIKKRGFHVVPQHKVGTRRLDLVIVGEGGRLAVECDGYYWHNTLGRESSDARRDRELARMGWEVMRIRESEFEYDPERAMEPLWNRLAERKIEPTPTSSENIDIWNPIDLPEDDQSDEEVDVA